MLTRRRRLAFLMAILFAATTVLSPKADGASVCHHSVYTSATISQYQSISATIYTGSQYVFSTFYNQATDTYNLVDVFDWSEVYHSGGSVYDAFGAELAANYTATTGGYLILEYEC